MVRLGTFAKRVRYTFGVWSRIMPKLKHRVPSYRLHKPSGNAIVVLNGKSFYLGPHGTQVSRDEYDRIVGTWQANGRRLPPPRDEQTGPTVTELIAAYWRFAQEYYAGAPNELSKIQTICTYHSNINCICTLLINSIHKSFGKFWRR